MGTPSPSSLELLALTSPGEFVERFLEGVDRERNASGSKSSGATLENLTGSWRRTEPHVVEGLSVVCKVREGGGEGEGESVHRVYAVVKDGVEIAHFSTNGYYSSDYGTDWDNEYTTVYPRQVVVTQYFTERA